MNLSQVESPVFWAKWRKAGAIGTALTAETQIIRKEAKPIIGIGTTLKPDGTALQSTLSIGEHVVNSGVDETGASWSVTAPDLFVVVPGQPFQLGQKIRVKDLPQGTQTVKEAFGHKV